MASGNDDSDDGKKGEEIDGNSINSAIMLGWTFHVLFIMIQKYDTINNETKKNEMREIHQTAKAALNMVKTLINFIMVRGRIKSCDAIDWRINGVFENETPANKTTKREGRKFSPTDCWRGEKKVQWISYV